MSNRHPLVRAYVRGHHLTAIAGGIIGLSALSAAWGSVGVSLPSSDPVGAAPVQIWVYLPLPVAALVVGGLHSDMHVLEEICTDALPRAHLRHLAAMTLFGIACLGGGLLITGNPEVAAGAVRNLLFWGGLGLISARLWRWSLSWILPLCALFPFDWFGLESSGPKSWAWPMLPPNELVSWVAAFVAVIVGLLAQSATPWRLRHVRAATSNALRRARGGMAVDVAASEPPGNAGSARSGLG